MGIISRKARVLSLSKSLKHGISPINNDNQLFFIKKMPEKINEPLMILQKMQLDILMAAAGLGVGSILGKEANAENGLELYK